MRVEIRRDIGRRPELAGGVFTILAVLLLSAGCASLPPAPAKTASTAFDRPASTSAGAVIAAVAAAHPGTSGFALLSSGRDALAARVLLTDSAEQSLDLQYYIYKGDTAGRILTEHLLRAADRGVRIRLLVDDNNLAGHDPIVAAIDAHPGIEVRIFNPFAHRKAHGLDFAIDFSRVNHRMHNKIMVSDAALAVLGGRNIGDDYFGLSSEANFRDLDVVAAGPIVQDIGAGFDAFWNSDWAYPVSALVKRAATPEDLERLRTALRAAIEAVPDPWQLTGGVADARAGLDELVSGMVWAPGQVVGDDPSALTRGTHGRVAVALAEELAAAEREILLESAYFVQRKPGIESAQRIRAGGVRIRVLTNSLASNDVAPAHAGYEKNRRRLVEAGVEVHELRPDAVVVARQVAPEAAGAIASLHTKAAVVDRERVFIGSFNLDPRSADLNTEVALLIANPELAAKVVAFMDEAVTPESSYRVELDSHGRLVWVAEDDGSERRWTHEPEAGAWERFVADLVKLLPIQSQL